MNYCKCGKIIHETSTKCRSCEIKRRHLLKIIYHPNYKGGKESRKCYCIDCDKELNDSAYYRKDKRCSSCSKKGELNYFFGKKLSKEHKKKISINHAHLNGKSNPMFGKITHGKYQKYNNIGMRSGFEVAFAKWCDKNNIKWQYEPKVFNLDSTTYTPDFYLPEFNLYIEVKGFWRDDAKEKFKLFKQKYCGIRIKILDKEELKIGGVL